MGGVVVSRDRWMDGGGVLYLLLVCVCVFGLFFTFYVWTRSGTVAVASVGRTSRGVQSLVEEAEGEGWRAA